MRKNTNRQGGDKRGRGQVGKGPKLPALALAIGNLVGDRRMDTRDPATIVATLRVDNMRGSVQPMLYPKRHINHAIHLIPCGYDAVILAEKEGTYNHKTAIGVAMESAKNFLMVCLDDKPDSSRLNEEKVGQLAAIAGCTRWFSMGSMARSSPGVSQESDAVRALVHACKDGLTNGWNADGIAALAGYGALSFRAPRCIQMKKANGNVITFHAACVVATAVNQESCTTVECTEETALEAVNGMAEMGTMRFLASRLSRLGPSAQQVVTLMAKKRTERQVSADILDELKVEVLSCDEDEETGSGDDDSRRLAADSGPEAISPAMMTQLQRLIATALQAHESSKTQ